jgi:hypothetical protein
MLLIGYSLTHPRKVIIGGSQKRKEPLEAVSVSRRGCLRIYVFGMAMVGLKTWNQNWIASDYPQGANKKLLDIAKR